MKTQALLLVFFLLAVEGFAMSMDGLEKVDIRGVKSVKSTPTMIPVVPSAKSIICVNLLRINFDEFKEFAIVTITNIVTGEVAYSETYIDVADICVDMGGQDQGKYLIEITLENESLEGEFTIM